MPNRTMRHAAIAFVVIAMGCGGPEYPSCDNDEQCHEGEFCVNGQCQQCRGDSDCAAGEHCAAGRCDAIEGWCASDSACPGEQRCENNRCVSSTVTQTTQDLGTPSCSLSGIRFDYNSEEITSSARATLQADAECIQARNIPHITLTGYCDPRGTEEYNLALGHRRALGVQNYLGRLGVDQSRMSSSSMGEEMAQGEDPAGWAQDRRVDINER